MTILYILILTTLKQPVCIAGSAHTPSVSSPDFSLHSQYAPAVDPRLAKGHGCNDQRQAHMGATWPAAATPQEAHRQSQG